MFGVDNTGRDILSPQFKRGGDAPKSSPSASQLKYQEQTAVSGVRRRFASLEDEMLFGSERLSVHKNTEFMSTTRRTASIELSRRLSREPQETEILSFINQEVDRVAMERMERMKKVIAEMAGRAVLRVKH